ncbi:uncharacterized protein LOC132260426 [Phlebotomus argentipes]|uniref:uncharacterized protein LOC132260426 n=1 Tax=Phlebotomus argentipes TaxID=94469 RepID=UPI002892CD67|nr:uncharacterized protein LOC132260426 [Phlebotomus argentipes]
MKLLLLCVIFLLVAVHGASILDYFTVQAENREGEGESDSENEKSCECEGFSCSCCVDFNMSLIDLGGPGCVRLTYLSPQEGIGVNVSYGESLLSSSVVKGSNPAPTCLNIFAKLAQMCAKFTEFAPTSEGMRACMELEPKLLGEVQLDLPIGCFLMTPQGMQVLEEEEEPPEAEKSEDVPEKPTTTEKPETIIGDLTAEDILNVVSDSADKGISMISNWLGLSLEDSKNDTETSSVAPTGSKK